MKSPLVSVIIPTYQRSYFLEQTIKSVVNQSYKNIEILVVDDGTVGNINEQICSKFINVFYFKIENTGGPCKPRNIGIKNANGTYIAFVDDDDIWLANKIQCQVKVLEENNDFGLVHNYCKVIDKLGVYTGELVGKPNKPEDKHGKILTRMLGNWTLMMPTPLLRKTLIDKVGFFNENMPQTFADVEYWSRCAFHTKFYYLDLPLVNYRVHNNNMSIDRSAYINMPIYIYKAVKNNINIINKNVYKKIKLNLCLMQAKMIKTNFWQTLSNMFKINPFWFINFRVQKTIIKKLIT